MNTTCPEIITDSQLARVLRVSVRWLRAEAEAGRLPCVRAERRLLFNREAVVKTLSDRAASEHITEGTTDAR
jgi:hypothetical protein